MVRRNAGAEHVKTQRLIDAAERWSDGTEGR
jgi:hypothetical protein